MQPRVSMLIDYGERTSERAHQYHGKCAYTLLMAFDDSWRNVLSIENADLMQRSERELGCVVFLLCLNYLRFKYRTKSDGWT